MNTKNELSMPSLEEMTMIMKYCEYIAQAPAYAAMGGMPGVFAVVMSARELGIPPMTALNGGLYLIPPSLDKEGKPKGQATIMMAAKTMSSMIWKNGHTIEVIEANDQRVTLKGTRSDNGVCMEVTMTMEKAKQAGLSHDLYGKPKLWSTWFKNSEDMLWKTCVAKLGRRLFTDVIGNCYEPSEFEEKVSESSSIKEKKILKGKNIIIDAPDDTKNSFAIEDYSSESIEEFVQRYNIVNPSDIDENDTCNQVNDISKYVQFSAEIKKVSFNECIEDAYKNKEKFIKGFEIRQKKIKNLTKSVDE